MNFYHFFSHSGSKVCKICVDRLSKITIVCKGIIKSSTMGQFPKIWAIIFLLIWNEFLVLKKHHNHNNFPTNKLLINLQTSHPNEVSHREWKPTIPNTLSGYKIRRKRPKLLPKKTYKIKTRCNYIKQNIYLGFAESIDIFL